MMSLRAGKPISLINFFRNRMLPKADAKIADFDGVQYHIFRGNNNNNIIEVNIYMQDFAAIRRAGADKLITQLYGPYISNSSSCKVAPDLTLQVDAGKISAANISEVSKLFGLLKRNILSAPLQIAFQALLSGGAGSLQPTVLNIRAGEQTIIVPKNDRVIYAVSVSMTEATDAAFAEQILDKIAGASKSSNGPNIKYTRDIPGDISRINGVQSGKDTVGFLLIAITKNNIKAEKMDTMIDLLLDVRHYVHYHIKASKAHLHQRMRAKVRYFTKVLQRARPEEKKNIKNYRVYKN